MDYQDVYDIVGNQKVKKINLMSNIKFIVNMLSLLGAGIYGWFTMESRITNLEEAMEKQASIANIYAEIELMKRDQEIEELRHKMQLDSLRNN
jgi:biopolymer transport protein ExbB/TolQ